MRRPGFEPGLPDWQSSQAQKPITVYDRHKFIAWLRLDKDQGGKGQELDTAKGNAAYVGTFIKSAKSPEDFVKSYSNPYTYNNTLFAVNHWLDYLGKPRLQLRQKQCTPRNLIISPKIEEMQRVIREIRDADVKAYIALCASVGLRPKRLLKATWQEIDFTNGFVNINERHGKKVYRPNPLHKDVAKLLQALPKTTSERIFDFTYHKIQNALKTVNTSIRPNNCRDFFYNYARKSGVDRDLIDWLSGHSIGIRAHYLADETKSEYAKFEDKFTVL